MGMRQEMRMTPQMIYSMEMLQLPLLALEQRIRQELMENPALEIAEMRGEEGVEDEEGSERVDRLGEWESPDEEGESREERERESHLSHLVEEIDTEWKEVYEEPPPRRRFTDEDGEEFDPIENASRKEITLAEHLKGQLGIFALDDRKRRIVERIIDSLAPSGRLEIPLSETVDPEETPPPTEEELRDALRIVQSLHPPGVGATSVKECLLLQIDALEKEMNRTAGLRENDEEGKASAEKKSPPSPLPQNPGFLRLLVEHHLEDLAANRLPHIAKSLRCSIEDIKAAITFLRTLHLHPGSAFSSSPVTPIRPDIHLTLTDDGKWELHLPNGLQPEISDLFLALFDTTKRGEMLRQQILADPERARDFYSLQAMLRNSEQGKALREKYQTARWLVTAVAQRERTLYRVAQEIVKAQLDYFLGKIDAPAPLMMQEVADRLGMDISTVSRTVRDKYIETPRGILPLRMFFTRAVGGPEKSGEVRSNVQIMDRIRQIIEMEDKKHPLRDDEIQAMLAKEGIEIKRRTVAKYRAMMGIPNLNQRRVY